MQHILQNTYEKKNWKLSDQAQQKSQAMIFDFLLLSFWPVMMSCELYSYAWLSILELSKDRPNT